ncbi:hypothetical protein PFLUV_G00258710%2C partial [Scomber scombrus]|uniref:Ig-like domain-containing protein n=1 Tax=Scomber scombrus TaxID=13677 RepID=A0AAV1PCB7_SCOSC
MESCVLPCSFQAGDDIIIHWLKVTEVNTEEKGHSYYTNTDQLTHQDQRFRGRTSLFRDQISRGNASLKLTEVEVQDEGRYKCYTSTISGYEESFINLRVDVPVHEVKFQKVENRIICSSDGIYPEPELTWSINPSSSLTLQSTTKVQRTEQQLYNISSSLMLSDNVTDLDYICTVSTRTNSRRASLIRQTSMNDAISEITIPCTSSNISLTTLIWRFNSNQTILTQTGSNIPYKASEEWIQQVKDVSKTGSLTLKGLSSKHDGTYTCELNNAEETYITNTFLKVIEETAETRRKEKQIFEWRGTLS